VIGIADGLGGVLRPEDEAPFLGAKETVIGQLMSNLYKKEY
jgi:hypothetical protein